MMLMLIRVVFTWRTELAMLLLIWVGVTSVCWSWILGVPCSMLGTCGPDILQLRGYMVAVSRVAVNHDGRGGSAPDLLVWDHGSKRKQRKTDSRIN